MSTFEDLKKSIEDGVENTITLALDDDTELECGISAVFQVLGRDYIALYPLNEGDGEVFLYRMSCTGDDKLNLENIVDDLEFELVEESFEKFIDEKLFYDDGEFDQIDKAYQDLVEEPDEEKQGKDES